MWRWISVVDAYAAGAALGATLPWIWYYGGRRRFHAQLLREFVGPPGLGATLVWAFIGAGIVLVLRGDGPKRRG
jgi:uncharacterized membrane protein YeaQ/YmgE (transglycosylase-associated protein family)